MTDGDASSDDETVEDDRGQESDDGDDSSHLDGLADGAGCTEIWERLSESRGE